MAALHAHRFIVAFAVISSVSAACSSDPADPPAGTSNASTGPTGTTTSGGAGGSSSAGVGAAGGLDSGAVTASGASTSSTSSGAGGAGGSGLSPGQVTDVKPSGECAGCRELSVACPGIDELGAILEVLEPVGEPEGTIFAHRGGGGTEFYAQNVSAYREAGFRVVRVRWLSDWEQTANLGILEGACRPATVLQWVFDNVHGADRSKGFCGIGHSGGSGALAYALAHYGMESILDYAALSAGPPFGRIDYGCAPQTYPGPARALCPELPDAPIALPPAKMNAWENTKTCGADPPDPAELATWASDSVVSPGADFDYPQTVVTFWDCATQPNGTTGGAYFYSREIESEHSVRCFTDCSGESLGNAGWKAYVEAVVTGCVPRHP